MSEEYYTRESRQILGALIETDGELTFLEILQRTSINMMIAVSVCSQLLRVEEITYRMINGVQYFRINEHFLQPQHPTDTCHLREEDIYLLFHQLLKQHIQEHFTVRDYASLLTLTPKQLTRIVLCASGKSAREWIEESTIREIRNMLEHTQFTIKEISNKLNFPNTAFFSRFFNYYTLLLVEKPLVRIHIEGARNNPKAETYLQVKNDFFSAIDPYLGILTKQEYNRIYRYNYFDVSISFFANKEFFKGCKILRKALHYGWLSGKEFWLLSKIIIKNSLLRR